MAIDEMTLRRLLQARPDLAEVLGQGTTAPTAPTMATGGFMTGAPPSDVMPPAASGFMPESLARASEPAEVGFGGGLWDRVKGFFDPDEEADPAQQRYDADLSSAGWAGASRAAAEAASNPNLSPIQVLTQALAGYSGAKQRAKADLRGEAREERLFGLKERELTAGIEAREFERSQIQKAAAQQQAVIDSLPPEKQDIARALLAAGDERGFGEFIAPKPKDPYEVDGALIDPTTLQPIYQAPQKPVSLAEGGALVDPLTGQVIASRPKTYAPQAPTAQYELEGGVRLNRFTGEIEKIPGAAKLPPLGELQAYRDSLPPGPSRDEVQAQIDKLNAKGGGGVPVKAIGPDGKARFYAPETVVEQGLQPVPEAGQDKSFEKAKDLRTAYKKEVAPIIEVATAYRKIEGGFAQDTGAGDIAGIFGYMKLLDPGSTVREGEYATAEQTGDIPDRIVSLYNKAVTGEKLTHEQRKNMIAAAASQLQPYRQLYSEIGSNYTGLAQRAEVDPIDVVTPVKFPVVGGRSSTGPVPRRAGPPPPGTPMVVDPNEIMNQVGIR